MSWDLDLCLHSKEKAVKPFPYFVKLDPQPAVSQSSCPSFPFFRLPIDLQLIVYDHCDAPTLFHLMRVCSRARQAVEKLFWEKTFADQWYHCHEYWLFEHKISTYVFTRHCLQFAHRITNIEIDLIRVEYLFREDEEDNNDQVQARTSKKGKTFWVRVDKVFPSVRTVVLSGSTPRNPHPPPLEEFDEEYASIESAIACAPAHIKVYIAFIAFPSPEPDRPPRNTLWEVSACVQPAWRMLDLDWKPTRVLLPARKWTVSPLGDFQTFHRQYHSLISEMRGVQWLMIESYARYAVDGIIHCPRLDCSAIYTERALWREHLSQAGHNHFDIRDQYKGDPMLQLFCYKHTPAIQRLAIEARQQNIEAQYTEIAKIQRRVGYGWGPPGSEQRRLFELEFSVQMKQESLYIPERPGPDSMSPEELCFEGLWLWFDRRHVYHGCSGTEDGHICYGDDGDSQEESV